MAEGPSPHDLLDSLNEEKSSNWELSKENIQPLKKGRKMDKLESDPRNIEQERLAYEANLRFYAGSDPLEPWYEYILWVEQMYPKGGSEGRLGLLIQKCISEFIKKDEYKHDPRFLDIWLKYGIIGNNILDCFKWLYSEKKFVECSQFYLSWASELELVGNFKKAETVYKRALTANFSPSEIQMITIKQQQFEDRVAKKVIEGEIAGHEEERDPSTEENRSVFSSLNAIGKKQVVGSVRVGHARSSTTPGKLTLTSENKLNAKKPFKVYEEITQNEDQQRAISSENLENIPGRTGSNQENDQAPVKWSSVHLGKKSHAVPLNKIGSTPSFSIHKDDSDELQQTPGIPVKLGGNKVLASSKPNEKDYTDNIPVAYFDPYDPSYQPMYCKHLVYQGTSELSFEEIEAGKRMKKKEEAKLLEAKMIEMQRKLKSEFEAERSRKKLEEERILEAKISQMQQNLKSEFEKKLIEQNELIIKMQEDYAKLLYSKQNSIPTPDDRPKPSERPSTGLKERKVSPLCAQPNDENAPPSENQVPALMISVYNNETELYPSEGFTVNEGPQSVSFSIYKEESHVASAQPNKENPFPIFKDTEENRNSPFSVYNEEEPQKHSKAPFSIYSEEAEESPKKHALEQMKQPFSIYSDKSLKQTSNSFKMYSDENNFESKVPRKPFTIYSDENSEVKPSINNKPYLGPQNKGYKESSPSKPEVVDSPLQSSNKNNIMKDLWNSPSANVSIKENPSRSPVVAGLPGFGVDNTILLPTMEDFAQKAKSASTPASFQKVLSYNSDDEDLVFKKPPSPNTQCLSPIMESSRENDSKSGMVACPATPKSPVSKRVRESHTPIVSSFQVRQMEDEEDDDDDDDNMNGIMAHLKDVLKNRKAKDESSNLSLSVMQKSSQPNQSLKASFRSGFLMPDDEEEPEHPVLENSVLFLPDLSAPMLPEDSCLESPIINLVSDPFNENLQKELIRDIDLNSIHGYHKISQPIPKFAINKSISMGQSIFKIQECIGEGAYAKVYKALRIDCQNGVDDTLAEIKIVLKVQKPPRDWEFYICSQIHKRLKFIVDSFMSIPRCFVYDDGSVFASEYFPASLLQILNISSKKHEGELIAAYFVCQLIDIVHKLRQVSIIHADIKPDNILVQKLPKLELNPVSKENMFLSSQSVLQMIDFGRSIDMTLFPPKTEFTQIFSSKDSLIPEMIKSNSWSYQLDYFGIASTAYALKFGSYIKLIEKNETFSHTGHYKRWWNVELWNQFYTEFLNIPNSSSLPDLLKWKSKFQDYLFKEKSSTTINKVFKEICMSHESLHHSF